MASNSSGAETFRAIEVGDFDQSLISGVDLAEFNSSRGSFMSPTKLFMKDLSNSSPPESPALPKSPHIVFPAESPYRTSFSMSLAGCNSPFLNFAGNLSPLLSVSNTGMDSPAGPRESPFSYFRSRMNSPSLPFGLTSPAVPESFSSVFSGKFKSPGEKENRSFVQRLDFDDDYQERSEGRGQPLIAKTSALSLDGEGGEERKRLDARDPDLDKLKVNLRTPIPKTRPVDVNRVNATAQALRPPTDKPRHTGGAGKNAAEDNEKANPSNTPVSLLKRDPLLTTPQGPKRQVRGVSFLREQSPEGSKTMKYVIHAPGARSGKAFELCESSNSSSSDHEESKSPSKLSKGAVTSTPSSSMKDSGKGASKASPRAEGSSSLSAIGERAAAFATPTPASRVRQRQGLGISPPNPTTIRKQNPCNCKKSQCLKLYCECFAAGVYCNGCNCVNCSNSKKHEAVRQAAIQSTLERNPNAFQPKIQKQANAPASGKDLSATGVHNTGCHCKKSACLKKYCECFQAGIYCGINCKCVDCKNFAGSSALISQDKKSTKRPRAIESVLPAPAPVPPGPSSIVAQVEPPLSSNPAIVRSTSPVPTTPRLSSVVSTQTIGNMTLRIKKAAHSTPMTDSRKRPMAAIEAPAILRTSKKAKEQSTPSTAERRGPNAKLPHRLPVFGKQRKPIMKSTAIGIFTYLDNDDLYNASLVNHLWTKLALDEEIWQY